MTVTELRRASTQCAAIARVLLKRTGDRGDLTLNELGIMQMTTPASSILSNAGSVNEDSVPPLLSHQQGE
jgi:hypothetical protein